MDRLWKKAHLEIYDSHLVKCISDVYKWNKNIKLYGFVYNIDIYVRVCEFACGS